MKPDTRETKIVSTTEPTSVSAQTAPSLKKSHSHVHEVWYVLGATEEALPEQCAAMLHGKRREKRKGRKILVLVHMRMKDDCWRGGRVLYMSVACSSFLLFPLLSPLSSYLHSWQEVPTSHSVLVTVEMALLPHG